MTNQNVPSEDLSGKRVAVVGGGFTGLTAAWRLADRGADVVVFEAADGVGGLAAGCSILDVPVEKAYHFLYKTDEYMLGLLDELALRPKLQYHKSSVSTYYGSTLYPMESPLDLIRFTPLSFINRIRAGVSVLYLQKVKNWQALTTVSAIDWLRRYAGQQVTDIIWEPLLRGKFDRYYDKVTMCWLWGRIKQRVESRDKQLGGEALGYVEGGFVTIIEQLVQRIEAKGGVIRLQTPVDTLVHNESGGTVSLTAGGQQQVFDRVLLTTPCQVAERLLAAYKDRDAAYFEKLASIDYLDAAVMLFATDEPISDYYWHNINTQNSPFVVFLSLTSLIGTERFNGKHVYYIGDYVPDDHPYMNEPETVVKQRWFDALKTMFPHFSTDSVTESQLFRFRNAQHIVDVGFESKIPDYQTPCPGVYLCNFAQIFPMDRGTNYAVRDGNRMAEMIGKDLLQS